MPAERILKSRALRAVLKKLPTLSMKATQENLDYMLGCCPRCSEANALAEAYRIGAEEAQRELAARIRGLGVAAANPQQVVEQLDTIEQLQRDYLTVADAIAPSSTSAEQLADKARGARQRVDLLERQLREVTNTDERDVAIMKLRHERDSARALARVLAHAYEHDSRPPAEVVRDALAFPVIPEDL